MRRIFQLTLLCFVGAGVGACKPDTVVATENIPTAGVRFINAVPDTAGAFGMDLRFVDFLESNAHYRIAFRNNPSAASPFVSTLIQFKGAREGSRKFRIFFDDTIQTIASTVVKDTTVSLVANTNYTALLWGNARSSGTDALRLNFVKEDVGGNTDTTQVGVRVINATSAPIDVRAYHKGGVVTTPTATWLAVPAYSYSAYAFIVADSLLYNVTPAGGGTALFADALALAGTPSNCDNLPCAGAQQPDISSSPGTYIAGSAVTGIVFPRSVVGARTPQSASFTVPAITFMWDRRPPKGCKPVLCG